MARSRAEQPGGGVAIVALTLRRSMALLGRRHRRLPARGCGFHVLPRRRRTGDGHVDRDCESVTEIGRQTRDIRVMIR